jgi:hypothetical protein
VPIDAEPLGTKLRQKAVDEKARLHRLRLQDGQPKRIPEELETLLHDGDLAEWKIDEAIELWLQTRRELRAHPNPTAELRLMALNLLLANRLGPTDKKFARGLRDASLAVVSLSRHKQQLRCELVRVAAREGHLKEAQAWLEGCDTHSDDLEMDTAYRYARAFLASLRKDYDTVLTVLGAGLDDVPIADQYDAVCAVLRADAYERRGEVARAVELLEAAMSRGMAHSIHTIVEKYQDEFHWCTQSFARAAERRDAAAAERAASRVTGGTGGLMLAIGLLHLLPGVGLLVWALFSRPIYFFPGGVLVAVGGGLALWGGNELKQQRRAAWVRRHGLRAMGTIVSSSRTGMTVNDVPQMKFVIRVERKDVEPYEAETKLMIEPQDQVRFQPGKRVHLRVDPQRPENVVWETG